MCLASAAWIAAATISASGAAVLALRKAVAVKPATGIAEVSQTKEDHHG
jgi:hypothetical protein